MEGAVLHHVSVVTKDLQRSIMFYRDVLGLPLVARPAFPLAGAWFRLGPLEIHVIDRPEGTYRSHSTVDSDDVHFALRVGNFESIVRELLEKGFREDAAKEDPMRILIKRNSMAGYHQIYIRDPDNQVIEINAEN